MLGLVACRGERAPLVTIDRAATIVSPDASPPPASAPGWEIRELPDSWGLERRRQGMAGWYRATFHLPERPGEPWAIWLPLAILNVAVRVNGELVGDGGRFAEPMARNWNRPLLFTVPARLLVAGENVVDVRLAASGASVPTLGRWTLGPSRELRPRHERRYWLQTTAAEGVTMLGAVLAALLWVLLRDMDSTGGRHWLVAALVLLTLASVNEYAHELPVPTRLWDWLGLVARTTGATCLLVGLHRRLGRVRPRIEVAMWLVCGLAAAVFVALPTPWLFPALMASFAGVAFLGVVAVIDVARRTPEAVRELVPGLRVTALALVAVGVHDGLRLLGLSESPVLLMPYAVGIAMAIQLGVILWRLVRAWSDVLRLNRELEGRVREKHLELERTYEQVRRLEHDRIVTDERQRITRDIHDGLGGHLVTTLAMLESDGEFSRGEVAEALRGALDDLRLVIDSLDPHETDLIGVLAAIRGRLEPRLRRRGLRFRWSITDLPPLPHLGPEHLLHVLRVVQEAITNVLKHARATTITVRTGVVADGGEVFVEVADDGAGFDPGCAEGRGLVNMRRRARELGGELQVATSPEGTTVTLRLPGAS